MDFLQLATQRYSVRSFSNRPIESEKMDRILKAGQVAPTAINFRSQKIDILKIKESCQRRLSLSFHIEYTVDKDR